MQTVFEFLRYAILIFLGCRLRETNFCPEKKTSPAHKIIRTPKERRESGELNYADYDKALYYTHRSQWDNLLILMVRTEDDLLSKRIEHFLHAYNFERDDAIERLYDLLQYIDHASFSGHGEDSGVLVFT